MRRKSAENAVIDVYPTAAPRSTTPGPTAAGCRIRIGAWSDSAPRSGALSGTIRTKASAIVAEPADATHAQPKPWLSMSHSARAGPMVKPP